ncbi:uncharacterized protein LOC110024963 [Phalaenopsis equestris]|uniref:uncharacterized protein LOC110024963 n=1 Tax=Phalaenopsis equestris TaxID=78828 RepID=UPI0009E4EA7B|nr:uncharacterized protein LOC110024963 [Phalaenopsis equestris]
MRSRETTRSLRLFGRNQNTPFIEVNIDGSFSPNKAGIGEVFRDHKGKSLLNFQVPVYAKDAIEAETMALYWAIKITVINRSKHLIAEMDSSQLVDYMTKRAVPPWHIQQWLIKLKQLCKEIKVEFSCIYREGNRPANFLAIEGAASQRINVSNKPPTSFACLLLLLRFLMFGV